MNRRERRHYSREQKLEAVKLVKVSGQSIAQVARDLDIPENTLWNWINRDRIDSREDSDEALSPDERSELRKLRRENRRLRMERNFLKKAAAFFAKEGEEDTD